MPVALGSMLNFFFMQPITLDSPHKKFNWILNKMPSLIAGLSQRQLLAGTGIQMNLEVSGGIRSE